MASFNLLYLSYSRHHGADSEFRTTVNAVDKTAAKIEGRKKLKEAKPLTHEDFYLSIFKK